MSEPVPPSEELDSTDAAVDAGNYEVLLARLKNSAGGLTRRSRALNEQRKEVFGGEEMTAIGQDRIRTKNNCVPRNIVNVDGLLLLAYNVEIGMKRQAAVGDVFSLHRFETDGETFDFPLVPLSDTFLDDPTFLTQFQELFEYYDHVRLQLVRMVETTAGRRLLAVFLAGRRGQTRRVFRWAVGDEITYVDNRGERDHTFPPQHDMSWVQTTHADHVSGRYPHVSVLDKVFVETIGGDLTVRLENNTEDGEDIYSEPVDDRTQSLDDSDIAYADLGTLILLRVRPFNESTDPERYLVFNTLTREITRIDAIGQACVQLPEGHGIIFPGGFYLRSGIYKLFDDQTADLLFKRMVRAPNGEDVLYAFHHIEEGSYVVLPYNLIRQTVQSPIRCHGYTLFDDGTMVVFRAESEERTRVHPMEIWRTPFVSDEIAAEATPESDSFLAKLRNADLVRGISDMLAVGRAIADVKPTQQIYEDLVGMCTRVRDSYLWLRRPELSELSETLSAIRRNAELIIDEFARVRALRAQATDTMAGAEADQARLLASIRPADWRAVQSFMEALTGLRRQRGHLIGLREIRYIDLARVDEMEAEVVERFDEVSAAVVTFLQRDGALAPITDELERLQGRIEETKKAHHLDPLSEDLAETAAGLDLLVEVVGGLQVGDPTARTTILEHISEVFGQSNRVRAILQTHRTGLRVAEARAEFGAQFKLLGLSVTSAIARADTPEKCDDQLSSVMLQLEELEGRFGEFDEFVPELIAKREEVTEAFSARRQTLTDQRQRRIDTVFGAAERILSAVQRRARSFKEEDELNAWFASDAMVLKLRQLSERLADLSDTVRSEELLSKLASARTEAIRGLRDRRELFADGDDLIRFGAHRFAVNTRPLELVVVPRRDGMSLHLTGTDFYDPIDDPEFEATRPYWQQTLISENAEVYRAEYLAAQVLADAEGGRSGLALGTLRDSTPEALGEIVRTYAADRYEEGYERGLHDLDASRILTALLDLRSRAGLLRFSADCRALAVLFWGVIPDNTERKNWQRRAKGLARMEALLPHPPARAALAASMSTRIEESLRERFGEALGEQLTTEQVALAGAYLREELMVDSPRFVVSSSATALREALFERLQQSGARLAFESDLRAAEGSAEGLELALSWVCALVGNDPTQSENTHATLEAAVLLMTERSLTRQPSSASTQVTLEGLLGQHPRVTDRAMTIRLDEFSVRLERFRQVTVPGFQAYRALRHDLLERERHRLRIEEYMPKVMSAFVRNRLINEVYLPMIGDNLAKQMGAAGAGKRTDNMGLLLLISPPGYGKTTLMEYVANRLGLVFMKVNGPALGHEVVSLDPTEAGNATARQEVEKLNLALEMGNNVMLYLDDIQHTHPELLQKFISLCDAQRRIEGVWKGRTRTYDMRGKKFCVIMAGNPYTESGARFQIPDMLSNRADTYNLGDILDGREESFALSYIENSVTSNPAIAPLAIREQSDLYQIVRMAQGEDINPASLSHGYSRIELSQMTAVLERLFVVRDILLKINLEYIRSAGMDDAYRTEPPFKLQGSYRNMNKLAEKVRATMEPREMQALVEDHYQGEAQTLTTGAEQNLLKLAELRGAMTPEQSARWAEIKKGFSRVKAMGGAEDDPVTRVTGSIQLLGQEFSAIRDVLDRDGKLNSKLTTMGSAFAVQAGAQAAAVEARLASLSDGLAGIAARLQTEGGVSRGLATIAERLDNVSSTTPPSTTPPSTTPPNPVTPKQEAPWLTPHLDLSTQADVVLRHAVLMEVQRALVTHHRMQSTAHRQLAASELVLSGTLPIMQELTRQISGLVRRYLPADQQEGFLDEFRREVAGAVNALSSELGREVKLSPEP